MTARSILFACIVVALLALRPASAEMLKGAPDAIVCAVGKGALIVYIARRLDDGSTLYESLEREFMTVITLDAKGILHWENRPDCDGKSVEQLRAAGQAFDFGG